MRCKECGCEFIPLDNSNRDECWSCIKGWDKIESQVKIKRKGTHNTSGSFDGK